MRVILLRHGHDLQTANGESSLSRQGRKSVRRTAESLLASGFTQVDCLLSSPSLRARESAQELADVVAVSNERIADELSPGAAAECLDHLLLEYPRHQSVVIAVVGHEPQLSDAALRWCGFSRSRDSAALSRWLLPRGEAMVVSLGQGGSELSTFDWPVDARGCERRLPPSVVTSDLG